MGCLCHCNQGWLSWATEYLQPLQANDRYWFPGGWHGIGNGDRRHRPFSRKAGRFRFVVVAFFQRDVWFTLIPNQPILAACLSVLVGLVVGFFGMFQGYIIAYLRVPAFIVTLGGMFILNGGILLATGGQTIAANQPEFSYIAQGYIPTSWMVPRCCDGSDSVF